MVATRRNAIFDNGAVAPTASWSSVGVCYSSDGFDTSGAQMGFTVWYQCVNEVQDLTINSWGANTNAGTPASVPSSARAGSGWTTAGRDAGVPVRNGSGWVLKQNVWGLRYIDGLCQIAVNSKPDQQALGTPPSRRQSSGQSTAFEAAVVRGL